jgi:hypothetical protein
LKSLQQQRLPIFLETSWDFTIEMLVVSPWFSLKKQNITVHSN